MTSLVRYRPFLPMRGIFDSFLNDGFFAPQSEAFEDHLDVDVKESEDEYVLTAGVPGVRAEDLSIEVEDGLVSISAQVSSEKETDKNGYLVRERKMGGFRRRLRLPAVLEAGKASAALENGVLTLTLPKAAEAKPRRIVVEVR
ncbi:MAG TPA: Hsp20/alpha crystallin family protein [Anaerolineales bacterium]|nr:Hsp20/alpha crystallin family protein [Anaerolineales bacterium]